MTPRSSIPIIAAAVVAGSAAVYVATRPDPQGDYMRETGLKGTGHECACSPGPDSGCEVQGLDGGWMPAPKTGNAINPGQWRGKCVERPCVELAGRHYETKECGE